MNRLNAHASRFRLLRALLALTSFGLFLGVLLLIITFVQLLIGQASSVPFRLTVPVRPDVAEAVVTTTAVQLAVSAVWAKWVVWLGLAGLLLALFVVLRHGRAFLAEVEAGDVFVETNMRRLSRIVWLIVGLFVLKWFAPVLALVLAPEALRQTDLRLDPTPDIYEVVGVLFLFVVLEAFRQGVAVRDDERRLRREQELTV